MSTVAFGLLLLPLMVLGVLAGKYYETARGTAYYIENLAQFTWFEAYFECSYRNMTLYTFQNQAQFDDLYQLLTSDKFTTKPPDVWLGAVGFKGKFIWINTRKPMTEHHLWSQNNPDNTGDKENCLHIWNTKKFLNDLDCARKIGFVCEADDMVASSNDGDLQDAGNGRDYVGKYKGLTINLFQSN